MSHEQPTTDEAIGRPGPWREGRYQKPDVPESADASVEPPAEAKDLPREIVSTPVTAADYE